MSYQGYLIANNATGLDKERQPWLTPDDSQFELFDGFVYRGVWQKREGYSQFADGERGGAPYCESRMVHTVTVSASEVPDGMITTFTFVVAGTTKPLRRGGFRAIDKTALGVQSQLIQDNGLGGTKTGSAGVINSVLNYNTTLATPQSVTFTAAPAAGHLITLELDVHQGLPVMGVMNFYNQLNARVMLVADTTYINKYNASTNRLDDITPAVPLTGNKYNFMTWCNYPSPQTDLQRLLFVNFKDPIQQYDGTSVTPYPVYTQSIQITAVASGVVGNGTVGPYTINTPANTGIVPGTLTINEPISAQTVTDNQVGILVGNGTGTVNYLSGTIVVTFNAVVAVGDPINLTYKQLNTPIQTALHISQFKDRLVVEYTIESGVQYGRRLRISGFGAMGDVFTADAIGAGVIDIPSNRFIASSDFNRDDRLIFLQDETWIMKYTQNDVVPFTVGRVDGSRGSAAPYGTITYLNRTNAISPYGMILSDGYSVERSDDKLPDFTTSEVDSDNFQLCFAGSVDKDRDHYLIYPSMDKTKSDRILVTNYEEDNFAIYRLPLSCMGNFIENFDVTWDDLIQFNTWDEMAAVYGSWNAFAYSKGDIISIGGGHEGQITKINDSDATEDYPVKIRNITVVDSATIQVTTDFQAYPLGSFIYIDGVLGMTEVNDKQMELVTIVSSYVFNLKVTSTQNTSTFGTYTSGGIASQTIVFDSTTKKFNPFANVDQKVACGWLYFYVTTSNTKLTVNQNILGVDLTNPCVINQPGHGYATGDQIYINGIVGTTQLNGRYYYITKIDIDNYSLDGVDATGYTAYSSKGYSSIPQNAILQVNCITNDRQQETQVQPYNPDPYQVNLTSQQPSNGIKKWYKLWINQVARFVQFQVINNQAGGKVQIQAMMPGFAGVGRMV